MAFNGAAVIQPRKRHGGRLCQLPNLPPSMGPRSFNRGNDADLAALEQHDQPSMGPRSFNRGNCSEEEVVNFQQQPSMGPRSFNRGNDTVNAFSWPESPTPSMGPRSFNRGNGLETTFPKIRQPTFNGAAVIQPRKPCNPADCCSANISVVLQWGRGHSTAETLRVTDIDRWSQLPFNGAAVIQPRKPIRESGRFLQWGRGHSTAETLSSPSPRPSMGPRSFNRGNKIRSSTETLPHATQPFNGAAVIQPRKRPATEVVNGLDVATRVAKGVGAWRTRGQGLNWISRNPLADLYLLTRELPGFFASFDLSNEVKKQNPLSCQRTDFSFFQMILVN